MLRLGWPGYTNEAIFLFHSTTLVFFSAFPAWQQRGDALYTPITLPININLLSLSTLAGYFVLLTFDFDPWLITNALTGTCPRSKRA